MVKTSMCSRELSVRVNSSDRAQEQRETWGDGTLEDIPRLGERRFVVSQS